MSLKCSQHGWGIGELGCMECDAKNSTENPFSKATVQMGRLSEAAQDLRVTFALHNHYFTQIQDPRAATKIIGSVV